MLLRLRRFAPLRYFGARLRSDDKGMALAAVIGLAVVALLIAALILTTVLSTLRTTTSSRANVQAQAAAQAGIVAASAGVQTPGSCSTEAAVYDSTTAPIYSATVYVPNGTGWKVGCPNASSGKVRIVSTGNAVNKAIAGASTSDVAYVEAVYTLSTIVTGPNDGSIFNTGTNGLGAKATTGQADKVWKVAGPFSPTTASRPIGSTVGLSPYTTTNIQSFKSTTVGNQRPDAWAESPFGDAQWVYLNDGSMNSGGDWYYRYQFSLPDAATASTFNLNISFLADNAVSEVWVNGVAQSSKTIGLPQNAPYPAAQYTGNTASSTSVDTNTKPYNPYFYYGYRLAQAANTKLGSDWIAGTNTIMVLVKSYPDSQGFLAQMRSDLGLCGAAYAPTGTNPPVVVTCATLALTYNRNVTSTTG